MNLNRRAHHLVEELLKGALDRKIAAHPIERGGRFIDCGIDSRGGLGAGLDLARICLADLADVRLTMSSIRPL